MAQTGNTNSVGTLYLSAGTVTAATDTRFGYVMNTGGSIGSGTLYQTGGNISRPAAVSTSAC